MSFIKDSIRNLEEEDTFFKEQGDSEDIAWLHLSFQDFSGYADSYKTAALTLIETALIDKKLRDYNVYPAIFLIRHYIELSLKEFIQGLNIINNNNSKFPTHHKIDQLWKEFKICYISIEDNNDNTFKIIDRLINELSSVDNSSTSFRYPIDKDGNRSQKPRYINLKNLHETFVNLSSTLDGISMQITYLKDQQQV